ncbi:MAG: modulator protein [Hyphomicrobiales bacterium]|nr:MAG: modulator protein [Hyphomicrobiales bacterium]
MTAELDTAPLEAHAAALVEAAKKAGADAADAVVVKSASLGVEVRNGKVEESQRSENDDYALRVFVGKRVASVSTNTFDDIAALAERAVAMARVTPEDPYATLADAAALARDFPDLDLVDTANPDSAALTEMALAAEAAGLAVKGVTKSTGASASAGYSGLVLATSAGFTGSYLVSRYSTSMTAIAGEGTAMERDYEYDVVTHLGDLKDPATIGRMAGERTVRRLNPTKLATQKCAVVYEPRVATSLVRHFTSAINGQSIARKTSFLREKLGEAIFAKGIRIIDDPLKRRGLSSRPFDGEGCAAAAMDLITDGVLQTWLMDTATAHELGLTANGRASRGGSGPTPGSTNLTLMPGEESPEALMKSLGSGIFVTDLIGQGVNGVTGDYSRGAAGFRFENGEFVEPVSEITIAGNLVDMFAKMVPANDPQDRHGVVVPTIAIEGLTIAGR